jgi:hypothetical protein
VGGSLPVNVEGQAVTGKIQALLPLPESFATLRELSIPLAAAWVVIPNSASQLEPGQRIVSPVVPTLPIATVDARALLKGDDKDGSKILQVIRNEYVTNVKVRVLGNPGQDRVQLTGALRPTDTLIVSTSVPLIAGTLIRFGNGQGSGAGKTEATTPNPAEVGEAADLTPPQAPGSAKRVVTKGKPSSKPAGYPGSTTSPATKADTKSVPF